MWEAACQNNGLHFPLGTLEIGNGLYRMFQGHLACLDRSTVVLPASRFERRVACTGYLITNNQTLLERIFRTDERFSWSLT
jgi:hypothetical protein